MLRNDQPLFHSPPLIPPSAPCHPLIGRLNRFVKLGLDECTAIEAMTRSQRTLGPGQALAREGTRPESICLMLDGFAYRYRHLADGRRQILGYLLPGDLCDTQFAFFDECDHDIGTLCTSRVASIPLTTLMSTIAKFPKIERGLLMMSIVDGAINREWLLNLGKRQAFEKLGHFFCELTMRFHNIHDDARGKEVDVPLTQAELADTMGLTVVHVNRVLQRFRREGLLNWSRRHFHILDFERLATLSGFDPRYLRLHHRLPEPQMVAYG